MEYSSLRRRVIANTVFNGQSRSVTVSPVPVTIVPSLRPIAQEIMHEYPGKFGHENSVVRSVPTTMKSAVVCRQKGRKPFSDHACCGCFSVTNLARQSILICHESCPPAKDQEFLQVFILSIGKFDTTVVSVVKEVTVKTR